MLEHKQSQYGLQNWICFCKSFMGPIMILNNISQIKCHYSKWLTWFLEIQCRDLFHYQSLFEIQIQCISCFAVAQFLAIELLQHFVHAMTAQLLCHVQNGAAITVLTHWPLGDLDNILKLQFSILFYWLVSSNDNAPRWMPWDLDDKSTLVQVMAWCRQATSHYLSQCWPWSMSPNGITRPQWVNMYVKKKLNSD